MARNSRRSNGMKKLQPAVMQMELQIPTGVSYIDLSLCASILNRRGYKQENLSWAVSSFEFLGNAASSGTVALAKLPETWVYDNAYQKSRALWHKMNDQVLDEEPSIQGKWHDFKIYLDDNMRQQTIQDALNPTGKILTPRDIDGNFTAGDFAGAVSPRTEWQYSQLTIPNDGGAGVAVDYHLHAVGPNTVSSKGLIAGYARSRSRPQAQDPNVPTTESWMTDLFDVGDNLEELRDIIVEDNDRAPYPISPEQTSGDFYPGGSAELPTAQIHGFCQFSATTVSAKNRIQGGMFQNGLILISNSTDGVVNCLVHMIPGSNRGYLCEAMD